ncbi:type VI secretion system-associated FHA domain protein TagH [Agrobacterium sp. a22-2]|uniref:type VI secretion system-associated FHA domain protein TagH n=1 Tax=Agrobacterium sp. a22-2 TaxID=2283840 RepID=UPI0014482337|nr:type VI secretion system-associated FHA domain protein TagH [Agrobacterium sp. a22-2]NKN36389.1 type VI secretion system-associated FHA domain protein TagH [Agrobacterium sp. a22-2]
MRLRLFLVGATEPSEHVFGPEGGLFGRSMKCHWVLPDPDRILSAIHGRIVFDNNKFLLIDESTNGIFLDGRQEPLGRGNSVAIQPGMRFRAARHVIGVDLLATAPARQAGFPGEAMPVRAERTSPLSAAMAPGQPSANAEQALAERGDWGDLWGRNSQDPLAYLGSPGEPVQPAPSLGPAMPSMMAPSAPSSFSQGQPAAPQPYPSAQGWPMPDAPANGTVFGAAGAQAPHQPFSPQSTADPGLFPAVQADNRFKPLPPMTAAAPQPPSPQPALPAAKLIPDDFDPLSVLAGRSNRRTSVAPTQGPMPSLVQTYPGQPSIGEARPIPPAAMPTPRETLSPALMADIARIDESQVMPVAVLPQAGPQAVPEAFDAIEAMKSRREERKAKLLEKAAGGMPGYPPAGATPSMSNAAGPLPTANPLLATQAGAGHATLPPFGSSAPQPSFAPPAFAEQPFASPAGSGSAAVKALFEGMGFPQAQIAPDKQVEVMREVGEMVRALSDGLVLLLSARRMVKTEFRMDETQVQPEENNPFKHFKMAELALDELFLTRSGGFQAPAEAAGNAFEDVKQHVILTMAAMQRAVRLLMERLGPQTIERDSEDDGALRIRGLGARKGKWEAYTETHARMSGNLDSVAKQIIAEAFAQVQEEQARRVASQYWESKK